MKNCQPRLFTDAQRFLEVDNTATKPFLSPIPPLSLTSVFILPIIDAILAFQESKISKSKGPTSISKVTDILIVLLLSAIVIVVALVFLEEDPYYLILAIVLSVLVNAIYIFLKIRA